MKGTDTDRALTAYLECALWSSYDTDDDGHGDNLDALYTVDDFAPEAIEQARTDVADFLADNADVDGLDPEQVGHDFWLTRNRHGAGFWDRGLGERGDRLTTMAHAYGESVAYVGDDGNVYLT